MAVTGPRHSLSILRRRDFSLFFAGQTVSIVGNMVSLVALPFAVLELTGSAAAVGLAFAATLVPTVIFLLAGGVWADRLSRRRVMLVADVVRAASRLTLAGLLFAGSCTFAELLLLQVVAGVAEAFFRPAITGLVPQTVPADSLQQANAMRGVSESLSSVAGPVLGGLLVGLAGPAWAIAVDGLTYGASAIALALMRLREVHHEPQGESFLRSLENGWEAFKARRWMWVMTLQAGVLFLVSTGPLYVLGPFVARESLGGAGTWGALLAAMGIGEICGGFLALCVHPRRPLVACCLLSAVEGLPLMLLAVAAPTTVAAAGAACAGLSIAFFTAVWDTTLQERIPERMLSRIASYDWLGSLIFLPIGMAAAGPLAATMGVRLTLCCAAVAAIVAGLAPLALRDVRAIVEKGGGSPEVTAPRMVSAAPPAKSTAAASSAA